MAKGSFEERKVRGAGVGWSMLPSCFSLLLHCLSSPVPKRHFFQKENTKFKGKKKSIKGIQTVELKMVPNFQSIQG